MFDARVRILALVFLSISYGIAPLQIVPAIVFMTVILCLLYKNAFHRGAAIIVMSTVILGIFTLIVWIFTANLSLYELCVGYLRWISLISTSVILFLSMNVIDIVSSLVYFKLPVRIALSVGIGLRFLPIFYEESHRVITIQRRRGITFSRKSISQYGFLGLLNRLVSPLLVSVLRRVDSISLSIVVQQLENRIANYYFPGLRVQDWIALLLIVIFSITVIAFSFM